MRYTPAKLTAKQKKQQKAQELVYAAYEARNPVETLDLIKKARELDPDNVDALCFMAAYSPELPQMINFYLRAVSVGKERLGDDFEEFRGHFWGFHETRPFMRAKAGLANALIFAGLTDEAIGHYWEMLNLNKMDNQGTRYLLSTVLLKKDHLDSYNDLLARFPDDNLAAWIYNHALFLFRQEGDTTKSTAKLYEAIGRNRHVPAYLLGTKRLPVKQQNSIILGETSEAVEYVQNNQPLWKDTTGALELLKNIALK